MDADIEIDKTRDGFFSLFCDWSADPGIREQIVAIILGLAEPVEMP